MRARQIVEALTGESMEAPAEYLGVQSGFGFLPDVHLWNLTQDIPGHSKGSTVSSQTLEKLGYSLPPVLGKGALDTPE